MYYRLINKITTKYVLNIRYIVAITYRPFKECTYVVYLVFQEVTGLMINFSVFNTRRRKENPRHTSYRHQSLGYVTNEDV